MKCFEKTVDMLAKIAVIFTFICFFAYFIKIIIFPEGILPYVTCFLVFLGLGIPFLFGKRIRTILKKSFLTVKAIYTLCLAFFVVSFSIMCILIFLTPTDTVDTVLPEDIVFVTFGSKIKSDGTPGLPLQRRLSKTKELMEKYPDSVVIVTGGKGSDEPISEAEAMKKWLISNGIDESRIIMEDKAKNTLENVEHSKEIIEEYGLSDRKIGCISSDYHVMRIRFISGKYDLGDYFFKAKAVGGWDYISLVREYLSYGKLIITGRL